jgi:thiamine-phosphate pyrophosphorylase
VAALADHLRLVVLTPGAGRGKDVLLAARIAIECGATAIWLRERQRERAERRQLALALERLVAELPPPRPWRIVAGDVDVALESHADAVHLGFSDETPAAARSRCAGRLAIGYSAHDPLNAKDPRETAALLCCDYATLSPFAASRKAVPAARLAPLGPAEFARRRRAIARPVIALGGIDERNARVALAAGADGVAVLRAATDPGALRRLAALVAAAS